ncbi:MAG: hypothetical protein KC503_21850 [Myxococcales bacterium]|nr:hypothetical protein [Myxococcales bacterium]
MDAKQAHEKIRALCDDIDRRNAAKLDADQRALTGPMARVKRALKGYAVSLGLLAGLGLAAGPSGCGDDENTKPDLPPGLDAYGVPDIQAQDLPGAADAYGVPDLMRDFSRDMMKDAGPDLPPAADAYGIPSDTSSN